MSEQTTSTPTPIDRVKNHLLQMATACARGELNPGALAREAFLLGLNIGRMEGRTAPQASTNEGGAHEPE